MFVCLWAQAISTTTSAHHGEGSASPAAPPPARSLSDVAPAFAPATGSGLRRRELASRVPIGSVWFGFTLKPNRTEEFCEPNRHFGSVCVQEPNRTEPNRKSDRTEPITETIQENP